MMNKTISKGAALVAAFALAAALAGCADSSPQGTAPTSTAETEQPALPPIQTDEPAPSADAPEVTENGNLAITYGEELILWDADAQVGTWSVTDVELVEDGPDRWVYAVWLHIEVTETVAEPLRLGMSGIDADGYKVNDGVWLSSGALLPAEDTIGINYSTGDKARGALLAAMPTEHGSIVLTWRGGVMGYTGPASGYEVIL